jgi:hypothetical protein
VVLAIPLGNIVRNAARHLERKIRITIIDVYASIWHEPIIHPGVAVHVRGLSQDVAGAYANV